MEMTEIAIQTLFHAHEDAIHPVPSISVGKTVSETFNGFYPQFQIYDRKDLNENCEPSAPEEDSHQEVRVIKDPDFHTSYVLEGVKKHELPVIGKSSIMHVR